MLKAKSENARTAGGLLKEGVEMERVEEQKERHHKEGTTQGYIIDCYFMKQH
jgi:hypothetical protein